MSRFFQRCGGSYTLRDSSSIFTKFRITSQRFKVNSFSSLNVGVDLPMCEPSASVFHKHYTLGSLLRVFLFPDFCELVLGFHLIA